MKLTFLGTSAGIPTKERNTTALAVGLEKGRDWYLFDCGEATQHRLLHTPWSAARLKAIFITHVHGDHCYGLPGLIASAHMQGRTEPLIICAPDGIEQMLRAVIQHTDLGHLRYPLEFRRSDDTDFSYEDRNVQVSATALSHRVPCFAYTLDEKPPLKVDPDKMAARGIAEGPLWGQAVRGETVRVDGRDIPGASLCNAAWPARRIVVGGDNDQPELLHDKLRDAALFIHEATFTEDILASNGGKYQHSTAAMVARSAAHCAVPNLILTHFSQRYRPQASANNRGLEELREEAAAIFSGQLFMANDLESYLLDTNGQLSLLDEESLRAGQQQRKTA